MRHIAVGARSQQHAARARARSRPYWPPMSALAAVKVAPPSFERTVAPLSPTATICVGLA